MKVAEYELVKDMNALTTDPFVQTMARFDQGQKDLVNDNATLSSHLTDDVQVERGVDDVVSKETDYVDEEKGLDVEYQLAPLSVDTEVNLHFQIY